MDYRFAFNQVFTFTGTDLVANKYERDVQQLPEVMLAEGDQALPIHHMSLEKTSDKRLAEWSLVVQV